MSMRKTIREWADLCANDTIREWWIENANEQNIFHWRNNTQMSSMSEALLFSFEWYLSPQGRSYWSAVRDAIHFNPEKYLKKRKKMFLYE